MIKVGDFFMFDDEIEVIVGINHTLVEHVYVFPPYGLGPNDNIITRSHIKWVERQPRVSPEEVNKLKAQNL